MADPKGQLGGFIARAQREGVSQNETMRTLRESGYRFGDRTFRSLWGEIEHARSLRGALADVNLNRRPAADDISRISGGKKGDRLYRFDLFVRRRGEAEVLQTHMAVKSRRLISYNTAMQQLIDVFGENEDLYGSDLISIVPAGVNEFTGEE